MVIDVLAEVRRQQVVTFGGISGATFGAACWLTWKRMSAPDSEPLFRFFFEAYGIALRRPKLYKDFLRATIEDWVNLVAEEFRKDGYRREDARAFATVVLSGLRGFMLDYCNTRDRKRVDRAVEMWTESLDGMLARLKQRRSVK
jgi:hypothetical protein